MDLRLGGDAAGPLAGLKVLDLSTVVSGPFCTQMLGDLGADVVKVESTRGDTTRMMGPPFNEGLTPIFSHFNRNKRSIALDLKQPRGREVALRLARTADVLVENFRPGVAGRLGLGSDRLLGENPRLVYVAISGFGPEGPYRDLPAYDSVIQGLVGFMPIQGGQGTPQLIRCIAADKVTAMTATQGVLAALLTRERGGGGQRIDVPMLDAYAAFMLPDVFGAQTFLPVEEAGALDPAVVHRTWETADGYVVMMIIEDGQFHGICRALEREKLIDDPRCANLITRIVHAEELFAMLEQELRKWPTRELVDRARRFGAPVAPANDLEAFLADPQVEASGTVVELEDPKAGRMRFLGNPLRFERSPTSFRRYPPRHGEHGDEVLRELGYGPVEVSELRAAGAVV
jgi:crotonobetainyl-CoA:carnitine CoA-transferase CaiB-like acyl-CoA transferase